MIEGNISQKLIYANFKLFPCLISTLACPARCCQPPCPLPKHVCDHLYDLPIALEKQTPVCVKDGFQQLLAE